MSSTFVAGEPLQVVVQVDPTMGTTAYAAQERIPHAWNVILIGDEGEWDGVHRHVRWGPFCDHTPRELTYVVQAPSDSTEAGVFVGEISCDGFGFSTRGDSAAAPVTMLGWRPGSSANTLLLEIRASRGQTQEVQTSTNLVEWTTLTTYTNFTGQALFEVSLSTEDRVRFFRSVMHKR